MNTNINEKILTHCQEFHLPNYKVEQKSYFSDLVENELKNYEKYLEYEQEGSISSGNKNWLIIDSSNKKHERLSMEIIKLNNWNFRKINILQDISFISQKYGLDEEKLINSMKNDKYFTNIIITSSLSPAEAISKFGNRCMFFIDLNNENLEQNKKRLQILSLIEENNFTIEDEKIIDDLLYLDYYELEKTLTKAFISALNDNSKILKKKYINDLSIETSQYIDELTNLIGLEKAKNTIIEIVNYLQISKKRNDMPVLNMCFFGNPGTGKTTVAKLVGKILSSLRILGNQSTFIEASRETLVKKYIGHSEEVTLKTINSAIGGVLFIDEAYSLSASSDGDKRDFGEEVINVLVNQMDIHKHDICIIFAGYKKEMLEFLNSNPGLESRIPFKIEFEDYKENELFDIFNSFLDNTNFKLEDGSEKILLEHFGKIRKRKNFGNGRYIRNFFERLKIKQANRIINENNNELYLFTIKDIKNTIDSFHEITIEKNKIGFN